MQVCAVEKSPGKNTQQIDKKRVLVCDHPRNARIFSPTWDDFPRIFSQKRSRAQTPSPDSSSRAAMIAQDFSRVSVLGAFSRGARGGTPRKKDSSARGHPSQEKRRKPPSMVWRPRALTREKVPHGRRLRLRPWPDPTVRGRGQRSLYPAGFSKYGINLLELKDRYLFNKRLGEISGLAIGRRDVREDHPPRRLLAQGPDGRSRAPRR